MRKNSGLTMIEIMVVIGLFAVLISLGLLMSMDVWRGASVQSEQDVLLSLLYKARSRAVANINEHDHGLYIDEDNMKYVIFEGSSYAGALSTTSFDMSGQFSFEDGSLGDTCDSDSCEVVFLARTGETDGESFRMTGQSKTREFKINEEGGIEWQQL